MKKTNQRKWLKLTQGIHDSTRKTRSPFLVLASMLISLGTHAQPAPQGGFWSPGGPPPGMMGRNQNRQVVDQFDADGDGILNTAERQNAAKFIEANPQGKGGRGGGFAGPGGPGNRGGRRPGFGWPSGPVGPEGPGGPGGRGPGSRGGRRPGFGGPNGPVGPGSPGGRGPGGRGTGFRGKGGRGPRGDGAERAPSSQGVSLNSGDVKHYPDTSLYDPSVLRTFFITFENPAWESELVIFNNTDVDVPATVLVDGITYSDVGIHFRGNSSFGVGDGYKRSLNLSFDFIHEDQEIDGYNTLNFLNANGDPTLLRSVLSLQIAREYIPAPKANLVQVVINGENWGVYANQQQFNKDFLEENFETRKGTRWKIPQGGGSVGGFQYQDEDVASYQGSFQIKSKDDPEAWKAIIGLAQTLQITPKDQLVETLESKIDLDSYLKFMALDNALVSGDGFWTRGADYCLYLHPNGKFHFIPYDMNEMFSFRGGGRGPGSSGRYTGPTGVRLDPLAGLTDPNKPVIERILAEPSLQKKYLGYVKEIATRSMAWENIGPVVQGYRELIRDEVQRDTRKLYTTEAFLKGTSDQPEGDNLRSFFDQRRVALLSMEVIQDL